MRYAVIMAGNKQYKVSEGDTIEVERITTSEKTYTFPQVLLYVDGAEKKIGTPTIAHASVTGTILGNLKGKKVRVAKFKAKSRYRRVTGFRPSITKIKIETIVLKEKAAK